MLRRDVNKRPSIYMAGAVMYPYHDTEDIVDAIGGWD